MFKLNCQIYFFLFLFLLCNNLLIHGQDINDLKKKLADQNDKDKIESYLKISSLFFNNYAKPDSSLFYANLAFKLSNKINYLKGKQKALFNIAIAFQEKSRFDTSIVLLTNLLNEVQASKNRELVGKIKLSLGISYRRNNNPKLATAAYLDAISAFERLNDLAGVAMANMRLAGVFTSESQSEVAMIYGRKTIALLPQVQDSFSRVVILSGLSGMFIQLSSTNIAYADSSIVYAKMALQLVDMNKYYAKGSQICISISNAYSYKGDFNEALKYIKLSMNYRAFLFPNEIIMSYFNFSDCYFQLKSNSLSLLYLDSAKFILKSFYDPFYEMGWAERTYEYNKANGNFEKSLEGKERFSLLKDSLFTVEKNAAINELEQKYNKSENEKKINDLNKENEIALLNVKFLVVGILAAALVILVIVFFYRQSVLKAKFTALETEQRLNRARMNPHFFFNALSSIQTLSMDKENSGKVSQLISQFSKIMRQALESTYDDLSNIEAEVDFLKNYLNIQKSRFPDKFEYSINVDEDIEVNEIKIPGMLLQPFIENSIEHGFKNINYKGQIDISFVKEEKQIKILVSDNGLGFNAEFSEKKYPSRATQIIADRLMLLNKKYNSNARFELKKNEGSGISVTVYVPIIY